MAEKWNCLSHSQYSDFCTVLDFLITSGLMAIWIQVSGSTSMWGPAQPAQLLTWITCKICLLPRMAAVSVKQRLGTTRKHTQDLAELGVKCWLPALSRIPEAIRHFVFLQNIACLCRTWGSQYEENVAKSIKPKKNENVSVFCPKEKFLHVFETKY